MDGASFAMPNLIGRDHFGTGFCLSGISFSDWNDPVLASFHPIGVRPRINGQTPASSNIGQRHIPNPESIWG
jgi:hypothetical protein